MERPTKTILRIGAWCVNPASGEISRDGETSRVEVRTMRLLLCLAEHAGEVVSIDDLLSQVWPGVHVNQDSVYQAVASLRRLLGDDPKQPTHIETVPRLGYRMVAKVSPWVDQSVAQTDAQTSTLTTESLNARKTTGSRLVAGFAWAAGAALFLALAIAFLHRGGAANNNPSASTVLTAPSQKSIAVLPFLDLTNEMNQEPFADGMTEELIGRLSKIPGLRVPSPTFSFYFKGKLWPHSLGTPELTIADIAKTLGVVYLLDGSVRKSGARMRVAARLIRADNGFVVWSETYDRPDNDILTVQDDIASEVTKALSASIEARPNH
jgi:TolB-like protein/DNA-binding winged helix-turn-helix (wHTH) protein